MLELNFFYGMRMMLNNKKKNIISKNIRNTQWFNGFKELKINQNFTFTTSSMGWNFAHHKEMIWNNT